MTFQEGALTRPPARKQSTFLLESSNYKDSNYCGNTVAEDITFTTSPSISTRFEWVIESEPTIGTCIFYIQLEEYAEFIPIMPLDRDVGDDGSFTCGTKMGELETALFEFDDTQLCDNCVIRWAWDNEYGTLNQCADIQIATSIDYNPGCDGLCMNGGTCNEDTQICVCLSGYSGQYCQVTGNFQINYGSYGSGNSIFVCVLEGKTSLS